MLGEKDLLGIALVRAREEAHFSILESGKRSSGDAADSKCSCGEIIFERLPASQENPFGFGRRTAVRVANHVTNTHI
jgi:hypothetical protein